MLAAIAILLPVCTLNTASDALFDGHVSVSSSPAGLGAPEIQDFQPLPLNSSVLMTESFMEPT